MLISERVKASLALSLTYLIYAAVIPLTKPALEFVTPAQFLLIRYSVAAFFFFPFFLIFLKKHPLSQRNFLTVFAIETVGLLNLILLYGGVKMTGALTASLLITLRPVFVTILSLVFLKEKEEGHEWLGLILSTIGAIGIVLLPLIKQGPQINNQIVLMGSLLILLTNLIDSINVLFIKHFYHSLHKPTVTSFTIMTGFILLSLISLATNTLPSPESVLQPAVLTASIYAALIGTVIGVTLLYYGLSKIEASEATVFTYLKPLIYIPLSVLWLRETFSFAQLICLVLIMVGVYWVESRQPLSLFKKIFSKRFLPLQTQSPI